MSFSDWLHKFAVGGLIALSVFATLSVSAQAPKQPSGTPEQQQPAAKQPSTNEARPAPAAKEANPPQIANPPEVAKDKQPETTIYQSACGDTTSHDQADLCEQKRMSGAAERAADYAYWQLYISGIGLGVVALSLWFAGIGAFAARDAARAGTEAARIARNAERPYIVPTNPMIVELNKLNTGESFDPTYARQFPAVFSVHFGLNNVGHGLAIILGYGINHELCAVAEHGGKELLTRDGFGGFLLSRGSQWTSEVGFHPFQITEDEFREIATTETKTLYVYGYIRYADLFGIVRRTGFSYEGNLDNAGDFGALVVEITNRSLWYDREEPDSQQT